MGLFDGQPLTREELIQVETKRRQAEGATIRKLSSRGPGESVWRTVRHKPWAELLGPGPDGMTCGDCEYVTGRRYFKCGRQVSTNGPGTDIRKKDPACRLFEAAGGGAVMDQSHTDEQWKGIGKLIEECGEVLQLAGKAIPFPVGPHPDGEGEIRGRMQLEIADLLAAVTYFITMNKLDIEAIDQRVQGKIEKFAKWGLTGVKP